MCSRLQYRCTGRRQQLHSLHHNSVGEVVATLHNSRCYGLTCADIVYVPHMFQVDVLERVLLPMLPVCTMIVAGHDRRVGAAWTSEPALGHSTHCSTPHQTVRFRQWLVNDDFFVRSLVAHNA